MTRLRTFTVLLFLGLVTTAPVYAQPTEANAELKPGDGVWANYDFIPGDRILFYEDFTGDNVGDFPRRLELVRGNWEVVEWQGKRLLRNIGPRHSALKVPLPEQLPERFTIEFDVHFPHVNQMMALGTTAPEQNRVSTYKNQNYFQIARNGTGVTAPRNQGVQVLNRSTETIEKQLTPIRIMVDDNHAKVYVDADRVANVPNAVLPRTETIWIENLYNANEDIPLYIGPIRIAAGGRDLYDEITTNGYVALQGILFSTGSAQIRPESTPVLKRIGEMLEQYPDLRLRIEGHTDNVGDDGSNQNLSEQRALSVQQYLIDNFDVDAGRLEAQGYGESRPIAPNETPEGRQQNRRVELHRL